MAPMTFNIVFPFGFPITMPSGGGQMLPHASGPAVAMNPLTAGELTPLHLRWFVNGMDAAKRSWSRLIGAGRQAGETFLTKDLLFSFIYGGVLATTLWWVWVTLGRPFHPVWIVAPLAMILTADWTESLIQLVQHRHSVSSDEGRIQYLWIKASYVATIIKLWLTLGLYLSLVGLVIKLMVTLSHRRVLLDAAH